MIRIDGTDYQQDTGPYPNSKKFDSLSYSIVGSAVYSVVSGQATSWNYSLLVNSAELSALRQVYAQPTAISLVTDEAVTATAYFRELKTRQILNPVQFLVDVTLVKTTYRIAGGYILVHPSGEKLLNSPSSGGIFYD